MATTRRRLPHWIQEGASYFITYRLADSVPQTLLSQWRDELDAWLRFHPAPWDSATESEHDERFTQRMEAWLDAGMGACPLRRGDVRGCVESALLHFDGQRYDVDSYALMPNHVHAILTPAPGYHLSGILKGVKGVSARECNALLGSCGSFWMDESHDHIVRDWDELSAYRAYIDANPRKAGLHEGEFSLSIRNVLVAGGL